MWNILNWRGNIWKIIRIHIDQGIYRQQRHTERLHTKLKQFSDSVHTDQAPIHTLQQENPPLLDPQQNYSAVRKEGDHGAEEMGERKGNK